MSRNLRYMAALLAIFMELSCAMVTAPEENTVVFPKENRSVGARNLLTSFVGSLMSRSYSTANGSQIVSVNLTNLLVLVLLKALIFAAGTLGAGALKDGYFHRSEEGQPLMTNEEMLLFLSFLAGSPGNNGCLQQLACKEPQLVSKYKEAGNVILKTAEMMYYNADPSYEYTLREVQEAIDWGLANQDCKRFICESDT